MKRAALAAIASLAITSLALAAPAYAKDADQDRRIEMAEEILRITQVDKIFKQISEGAITGQKQALQLTLKDAEFTDEERNEIIEEVSGVVIEELQSAFDQMTEKLAPLYADVYTAEELAGILAFYESPAGKAMLAKQDVMMQRSIAIGQQWNAENLPAAMQRMTPRIEAIIKRATNKD